MQEEIFRHAENQKVWELQLQKFKDHEELQRRQWEEKFLASEKKFFEEMAKQNDRYAQVEQELEHAQSIVHRMTKSMKDKAPE